MSKHKLDVETPPRPPTACCPAKTVADYAAWLRRYGASLSPGDQAVADFLEQHGDLLQLCLYGWGGRRPSQDQLQEVMLAVVEGVRAAQNSGLDLNGPFGPAMAQRIVRNARNARERARRREMSPL